MSRSHSDSHSSSSSDSDDGVTYAYVSQNLCANSAATSYTGTTIPFNNIDTNDKHFFSLKSDGSLKIKRKGHYSITYNTYTFNADHFDGSFGVYVTLNGEIVPTSQNFRRVHGDSSLGLTSIVTFKAKRGDKLAINVTVPSTTMPLSHFKIPEGPLLLGWTLADAIATTQWSPNYYEIVYTGRRHK